MSEQTTEQPEALKVSNDQRRMDRLQRKAKRAHEWRVRVWAESELAIQETNASIEVLGGEVYVPWTPDFGNADSLRQYAAMTISK